MTIHIMITDLDYILPFIENIARDTGRYLINEQSKLKKSSVELKSGRNYVTYIDKEAERLIVSAIQNQFPHTGFLTEEETIATAENKEYIWIIDPLDGTTNYVHGDTPYSVSIALMHNQQIVLGVVYDPVANEMYSASTQHAPTLNGNPIRVSNHGSLVNGYIGFGIPYQLDDSGESILKNAGNHYRTCSFRIKGSAAVELCYVAAGKSDAYFHSGLSPWDVAAGSFILTQAGGRCTDFADGDNYVFGKEMVASNGAIHDEIMTKIINPH